MKQIFVLLVYIATAHYALGDAVSYLRFEENTGTVAHDETGLMDGEMLGIWGGSEGWSTDVPVSTIPQTGEANNSSIRFGGGSEYIDLSNYNDLLLGYSFTIEMFIKPEEPTTSYLFSLSPSAALGMNIFREGDGTLSYLINHMGISLGGPFVDLIIGEWQHIAYVKMPGEYSVYLDGVQVVHETLASSLDGPYDFPGVGTIGDRAIGNDDGGTWRGWLDEFRISDEALSPSQFLNASIPEPGTLGLLLFGAAGLAWRRQRK